MSGFNSSRTGRDRHNPLLSHRRLNQSRRLSQRQPWIRSWSIETLPRAGSRGPRVSPISLCLVTWAIELPSYRGWSRDWYSVARGWYGRLLIRLPNTATRGWPSGYSFNCQVSIHDSVGGLKLLTNLTMYNTAHQFFGSGVSVEHSPKIFDVLICYGLLLAFSSASLYDIYASSFPGRSLI
jgi:hypothetical protein